MNSRLNQKFKCRTCTSRKDAGEYAVEGMPPYFCDNTGRFITLNMGCGLWRKREEEQGQGKCQRMEKN